jgi:hypothetical protein
VALRAQVVDLVGRHGVQQVDQPDAVMQVAVVKEQPTAGVVRILVDAVDSLRIERRGPPDQAVDVVSLRQQQFGEVGAVLAGDAGHQGRLAIARSPGRCHRARLAAREQIT